MKFITSETYAVGEDSQQPEPEPDLSHKIPADRALRQKARDRQIFKANMRFIGKRIMVVVILGLTIAGAIYFARTKSKENSSDENGGHNPTETENAAPPALAEAAVPENEVSENEIPGEEPKKATVYGRFGPTIVIVNRSLENYHQEIK